MGWTTQTQHGTANGLEACFLSLLGPVTILAHLTTLGWAKKFNVFGY